MNNLLRKLTSRKFWCAVAGLVVSIAFYFGADEGSIGQVASIITGGLSTLGYMFAEGIADWRNKTDEKDKDGTSE